jgi:hypothetical protein
MDTSRSFSHAVSEHRYKASGFQEIDIIFEPLHNSLDANSSKINFQYIKNNNNYYLLIMDDGIGSDNPESFFGIGNKVIKKKGSIGCKNIGLLASVTVIEPISVMILTKKENDKNIRRYLYKVQEHHKELDDLSIKYNNDYKKIDDSKLFDPFIEGDFNDFISENKNFISNDSYELFENIKKNRGTSILLKFTEEMYNRLCNKTIYEKDEEGNNNSFIHNLSTMTRDIDKVKFFNNKIEIKKEPYQDILYQGYKPIIIETNFIQVDNKKYFERNIYINEKNHNNHVLSTYFHIQSNNSLREVEKVSYKSENIIGNFIINYYFYEQNFWENLLKKLGANRKRSIIYDFYESKYRFFSETNSAKDSKMGNGGTFFMALFINANNMELSEKYLGIKMNKSLSSTDSYSSEFKNYIFNKIRDVLIDNISYYTNSVEYGKFKKWCNNIGNKWYEFKKNKVQSNGGEFPAEGIKDWSKYKDYIKDIFSNGKIEDNGKPLFNNMFIAEYIKNNKLVIPVQKIDPKPPKKPSPPVLPTPKLKNPELKVNTNAYWGEITFDINTRDFDEIHIKYLHNNKEIRKIINDDIYDIKGLNPHCEYEFKVIGIINQISKEKIIKIKLDNKCKPEPPKFTVKDSTHDIEINFVNTIDHGLPIKNILLFKDNDTSAFERKPYNNQIKLDTKIHKRTKLIVKFENEFKCSEGTAQIIKNKECDREHFSEQVKKQSLEKTRHRCSKSNIYFDDKYFKCEFDHKDGQSCNNSIENCQPLLVEIHNLKTYHSNEFKKLDESDELFVYKYKRISGIFESLSNEDKQKILDTLKKEYFKNAILEHK